MQRHVLLVDDDNGRGRRVAGALSNRHDCRHVTGITEAMAALSSRCWHAVVTAYELGTAGSGLEVLQVVRESAPWAFRLCYGLGSSTALPSDVRRLAAPHFVAENSGPELGEGLAKALAELFCDAEGPDAGASPGDAADGWVACSPASRRFLADLRRAAEQDTPVYLWGESGSGRAFAARLLQRWRSEWKERGSPGAGAGRRPVVVIRVPSLRERPQDLPALAEHCLLEHSRQTGGTKRRLTPGALDNLRRRDWQSNGAELVLVLLRAIRNAGERQVVDEGDLPADARPAFRPSQLAKEDGQRDCLLRQLRTARTVSAAARLDVCSRANYIRLMRRLGILRADVRNGMEREPVGVALVPAAPSVRLVRVARKA